jgi:pimeloyl-ACP methyl ester carboxylesterase
MTGKVIYLHGFASGPGSKKAQYFKDRFAEVDLPVLIPDLAAGNFEKLTISGQLRVIKDAAGQDPVTLIGSSLGGYLAALFAARHPQTQRVVLLAPGFGFARRWPERLGAQTMQEWERTGVLPVFHYGDKAERLLSYDLIEDGRQYEDYPEMRQPCLIFHGEHDDVVPAQWSREFAEGKDNVELHVVDSDHELLNVVEPMWRRVREFVTA